MKKITLVVLLLITGLSIFAKQSKHKKQKQQGNEFMSLALHHTGCYGRCPTYIIEINRNGIATYTGIRFTPDSGIYTKKIGVTNAMEIINLANEYRIDTCKDRYENRVQDLPGINYTINFDNKTKPILNANYGPYFLAILKVKMDSVLDQKADESGLLPLDKSWHKATGGRK